MEVGRHGAGNTGWCAKRWSHRERVSDVHIKGRSKREKEETEGEKSSRERKRKREKNVEKAIEDTARTEGRRGTDLRSKGSRWFFVMKGTRRR